MNAIYLRRRLKVVLPTESGTTGTEVIATLQKNIQTLGFLLSPEICQNLEKRPLTKVDCFYQNLVASLREMTGAHREFQPMYPNFPAEVMEMQEAELYWNALVHYWTHLLVPVDKREREPLFEDTPLQVIHLGTREEFEGIFTRLAAAKASLSAEDKKDVVWFVSHYRDDIARLLPAKISSKENLAILGAALLKHTTMGEAFVAERLQTATDVLRLAVALSEGDVSLAEKTKFGKFTRKQRQQLLSSIERCANPTEDMLRWKGRWVRLGERLHPGEYVTRFPKAQAAFNVLRNDLPFQTFNARVEASLLQRQSAEVVALLQSRPGELTRRLDHLVRTAPAPEEVVSAFQAQAGGVSTPVLLQAMAHFTGRLQPQPLRAFFPKGDVAKVYATQKPQPPLPEKMAESLISICEETLLQRFAKLPALGPCYLDPELKNHLVPFSQRSASKALRTLVRGSRLALPNCEVLRFFIWWRNGKSRTDIDLSAGMFDADFKYVNVVSYYSLKALGGCHSGDIVDAPQGAAEFIDLSVPLTKGAGVRYIVMSINSFTMQPYCDLPECFAGWMARDKAGSGEIFEARTVQNKVDISSNTSICLPAVFDLVEQKVIWADLALRSYPHWNNVKNNLSGISLMMRAIQGLQKTTLHTLFDLHIRARGQKVAKKEEACTVFAMDEGITPFDQDRIMAEYL